MGIQFSVSFGITFEHYQLQVLESYMGITAVSMKFVNI